MVKEELFWRFFFDTKSKSNHSVVPPSTSNLVLHRFLFKKDICCLSVRVFSCRSESCTLFTRVMSSRKYGDEEYKMESRKELVCVGEEKNSVKEKMI